MTSNGDRRRNAGSKLARQPEGAKSTPVSVAPHISRLIEIDQVPETGLLISVRADAAERAAIAKADGLVAVVSLEADIEVVKESATKFRVSGPLKARVVQTCVVSLDAFESEVQAEVEAEFAAPVGKSVSRARAARDFRFEGDVSASFTAQIDAPDPIVDGRIDVGALVEEFLILSLDAHPRKPSVQFESVEFSERRSDSASPFAALKKLREGD